jgi:galactosamine-6-phosphate isomerase
MNHEIHANYDKMSRAAMRYLTGCLRQQPDALFCLATGGSPTLTYDLLAQKHGRAPELFRRLRILKLDDWGGLAMKDPGTSEQYLQRHLIQPLKLGRRYFGFTSNPANPSRECARIHTWLQAHGPIDVCVLGLGLNGHLAFNEPAPFLQPHAHVARLSRASMNHSMVKLAQTRPKYGLTLGMADLLQARRILLLVSGKAKRGPLAQLLKGQITSQFPASYVWLHPDITVMCDRDAMRE